MSPIVANAFFPVAEGKKTPKRVLSDTKNEHKKNPTSEKRNKHEAGQTRQKQDQARARDLKEKQAYNKSQKQSKKGKSSDL